MDIWSCWPVFLQRTCLGVFDYEFVNFQSSRILWRRNEASRMVSDGLLPECNDDEEILCFASNSLNSDALFGIFVLCYSLSLSPTIGCISPYRLKISMFTTIHNRLSYYINDTSLDSAHEDSASSQNGYPVLWMD